MISLISVEDVDTISMLGSELHENVESLYDYNSLNEGVNKTYKYEENGETIGFIHIQDLADEIDIIDIIINKKYRLKGYGSELLEYVIKEYNSKRFILEVSSMNEQAINLYKKYGFKIINIRKGYMHGIDALVMEKK